MNKCKIFLFGHDWDNWEVEENGDIIRKDNEVIGKYIIQKRQCKNCKYIELKNKKTYL